MSPALVRVPVKPRVPPHPEGKNLYGNADKKTSFDTSRDIYCDDVWKVRGCARYVCQ